jgi:hypothetical protein
LAALSVGTRVATMAAGKEKMMVGKKVGKKDFLKEYMTAALMAVMKADL